MGAPPVARAAAAVLLAVAAFCAADPAAAHDKGRKSDPGTVWLSATLRLKGASAFLPTTICVTGQTVSWKDGKDTVTVQVPDSAVSFRPWQSMPNLYFNGATWEVTLPTAILPVRVFMAGAQVPVADLPKKLGKLTWRAQFSAPADRPGLSVQYAWTATAFRSFSPDYEALRVAPIDDRRSGLSAGTPLAFVKSAAKDRRGHDDDDDCDHDHGHEDDDDDGVLGSGSATALVGVGCVAGGVY